MGAVLHRKRGGAEADRRVLTKAPNWEPGDMESSALVSTPEFLSVLWRHNSFRFLFPFFFFFLIGDELGMGYK